MKFPLPARSLTLLTLCLGWMLTACSGESAPQRAEFIAPAPAQQDFGQLRVHYNALPSLSLSEAVAREYGIQREADTALIVIAPRKVQGQEETAIEGSVEGVAHNLSGNRQTLAFHPVHTGNYIDYIGTVQVEPRDSYRFEISVRANGRQQTLKFQKSF